MDEQSIFIEALEQPTPEARDAWLEKACGADEARKQRLKRMLAKHEQDASFLEQPVTELHEVLRPDTSQNDCSVSLDTGPARSFGSESAVLFGEGNHSVLRALGKTLRTVPRVSLRESEAEGSDPVSRPNSPEIPRNDSTNRYQLQGEIARGGMGAILKGRDTDLGRDLAIKVLLDSHKNAPEVVQRFVEEAQIGGQLQHPGIAPIYELGQFADQRPFFAMKLVKGQTLSKLLSERGEPSHERGKFIGIFEQVCQTMAYAHSRGVIHRDLKPANIMVGAFGEVQVMDWGLAKVLRVGGVADEKRSQSPQQGLSIIQTLRSGVGSDSPAFGSTGSDTKMGSVMGTPAYMPPEQALGEIDLLDERADVFGLGSILCEILTGQPPYVADDGTNVFRLASRGKLDGCFRRLQDSGADQELINLARQCLELEPCDRPRDAGVVVRRVTGYLEAVEAKLRRSEIERAEQTARADAESARADADRRRAEAESQRAEAEAARASEERQRRKTSLALAASLLLMVSLGSGGWLYLERREANRQAEDALAQRRHAAELDSQRAAAEEAKKQAIVARTEAVERADEAEQLVLYVQAEAALADRQYRRAYQLNRKAADREQHWEYDYKLHQIVDACRSERKLLASIDLEDQPACCALLTGEQLVFGSEGNVQLYSIRLGRAISSRFLDAAWRSVVDYDSEHFVAIDGRTIHYVALPSLEVVRSKTFEAEVRDVKTAPAVGRLAVCLDDHSVVVLDTTEWSVLASRDFPDSGGLAFSPSGNRIVTGRRPFYRWDIGEDQFEQLDGFVAHSFWFHDDDQSLTGLRYIRNPATEIGVRQINWSMDGDLDVHRMATIGNVSVEGRTLARQFHTHVSPLGEQEHRLAIAFETGCSFFDPTDRRAAISFAYKNLWPHASTDLRFEAISARDSLVALSTDQQLLVFRLHQVPEGRATSRPSGSRRVPTVFWTLGASDFHAFCYEDARGLVRHDFAGDNSRAYQLQIPDAAPGKDMSPWGVSVTPSGDRVAMLWQESDDSGSQMANYFRKLIAIYQLPAEDRFGDVRYETLIHLKELDGSRGRVERWMDLSGDGNLVSFGTSNPFGGGEPKDSATRVYDTRSGEHVHSYDSGEYGTFSRNGQFFATYSMSENRPLQLYRIDEPTPLASIELTAPVERIELLEDRSELRVGLSNGMLASYDWTTGKLLSERKTPVSPVCSVPGSELQLGYIREQSTMGQLVLTERESSRVVEVVRPNYWFTQTAYTAIDGRGFACIADRDAVLLVSVVDDVIAESALSETQPYDSGWRYAHLDEVQVSNQVRNDLRSIESDLEAADPESAIETYSMLALLPLNRAHIVQLRNLFSRKRCWRGTRIASQRLFDQRSDLTDAQSFHDAAVHLVALALVGDRDDYRAVRRSLMRELLAIQGTRSKEMLGADFLMINALLIDTFSERDRTVFRSLMATSDVARRVLSRPEVMAMAKLRVGDYEPPVDAENLDESAELSRLKELVKLYQAKPSEQNKTAVEAGIREAEAKFRRTIEGGFSSRRGWSWHVKSRSFIETAKSLVESS